MKTKFFRVFALVLILALVPFAAFAESDASSGSSANTTADAAVADDSDTTGDTNDAGMPYVLNAFEGTNMDLTPYEGKAIWLNFFTGWCPYCMTEMPYIKQIFDDYDPEQVAILLVHVWDGETADDSQEVIEKYGLQDMTMIEDEQMTLAGLVGLQGYPTSFFIDKDGYLYAGTYGLDYDGMAQYMAELNVAKRPDTVAAGATAVVTATPAPDEVKE